MRVRRDWATAREIASRKPVTTPLIKKRVHYPLNAHFTVHNVINFKTAVTLIKGASALGTECALNAHSIRIDRVRTRNVKVPNRIECALSQSTFVCGLNPVRSGLEWNVDGRSLRHMMEVCAFSRDVS